MNIYLRENLVKANPPSTIKAPKAPKTAGSISNPTPKPPGSNKPTAPSEAGRPVGTKQESSQPKQYIPKSDYPERPLNAIGEAPNSWILPQGVSPQSPPKPEGMQDENQGKAPGEVEDTPATPEQQQEASQGNADPYSPNPEGPPPMDPLQQQTAAQQQQGVQEQGGPSLSPAAAKKRELKEFIAQSEKQDKAARKQQAGVDDAETALRWASNKDDKDIAAAALHADQVGRKEHTKDYRDKIINEIIAKIPEMEGRELDKQLELAKQHDNPTSKQVVEYLEREIQNRNDVPDLEPQPKKDMSQYSEKDLELQDKFLSNKREKLGLGDIESRGKKAAKDRFAQESEQHQASQDEHESALEAHKKELEEHNQTKKDLTEAVKRVSDKLRAAKERHKAILEGTHSGGVEVAEREFAEQKKKIEDAYETHQAKLSEMQADLADTEGKHKTLKDKDLKDAQAEFDAYEKESVSHDEQGSKAVERSEFEIEDLQKERAELKKQKKDTASVDSKISQKKDELKRLKRDIKINKHERSKRSKELRGRLKQAKANSDSMERTLTKKKSDVATQQKKVQAEKKKAAADLKGISEALKNAKSDKSRAANDPKVKEAEKNIADLEAEHESAKNALSEHSAKKINKPDTKAPSGEAPRKPESAHEKQLNAAHRTDASNAISSIEDHLMNNTNLNEGNRKEIESILEDLHAHGNLESVPTKSHGAELKTLLKRATQLGVNKPVAQTKGAATAPAPSPTAAPGTSTTPGAASTTTTSSQTSSTGAGGSTQASNTGAGGSTQATSSGGGSSQTSAGGTPAASVPAGVAAPNAPAGAPQVQLPPQAPTNSIEHAKLDQHRRRAHSMIENIKSHLRGKKNMSPAQRKYLEDAIAPGGDLHNAANLNTVPTDDQTKQLRELASAYKDHSGKPHKDENAKPTKGDTSKKKSEARQALNAGAKAGRALAESAATSRSGATFAENMGSAVAGGIGHVGSAVKHALLSRKNNKDSDNSGKHGPTEYKYDPSDPNAATPTAQAPAPGTQPGTQSGTNTPNPQGGQPTSGNQQAPQSNQTTQPAASSTQSNTPANTSNQSSQNNPSSQNSSNTSTTTTNPIKPASQATPNTPPDDEEEDEFEVPNAPAADSKYDKKVDEHGNPIPEKPKKQVRYTSLPKVEGKTPKEMRDYKKKATDDKLAKQKEERIKRQAQYENSKEINNVKKSLTNKLVSQSAILRLNLAFNAYSFEEL